MHIFNKFKNHISRNICWLLRTHVSITVSVSDGFWDIEKDMSYCSHHISSIPIEGHFHAPIQHI